MRTFRRSIGLSPYAYLTQIRVEAAKKLLNEGASIADVASDIGFTDQSHLTRHFKANYWSYPWTISSAGMSESISSLRGVSTVLALRWLPRFKRATRGLPTLVLAMGNTLLLTALRSLANEPVEG